MEKIITDFSVSLFLWQAFQVIAGVAIIYLIFRYFRRGPKQ